MDILTKIANRTPAPKTTKLVKRWVVMVDGRMGRGGRVYTFARAKKLVARATRRGIDCYAAPMMVRV